MSFGKWMVVMVALTALVCAGCDDRGAKSPEPSKEESKMMPKDASSEGAGTETSVPELPQNAGPQGQVTDTLWVMESRGTRQCEGGGLTVEQSRGKLVDGGIQVVESRCGVRTDRMYPQVCGGATGDILLHRIPSGMLDAALELGFDPVGNVSYQFSSCAPKPGTESGRSEI